MVRLLLLPLLLLLPAQVLPLPHAGDVCIVGAGISGASTAFFLTNYTTPLPHPPQLRVFERRARVGGRLATVTIAGDHFEAGGSIIHSRNLHARRFADLLDLAVKTDADDDWLGIWDGTSFVFQTLRPPLGCAASCTASSTRCCCSTDMASPCSRWTDLSRKCCKGLCFSTMKPILALCLAQLRRC